MAIDCPEGEPFAAAGTSPALAAAYDELIGPGRRAPGGPLRRSRLGVTTAHVQIHPVRIQSALNSCSGTGRAVVLAPSGSNNAFLSGPLSLPASVTLLIVPGVTLYASRNPASYPGL